jgi:hypothetical protein
MGLKPLKSEYPCLIAIALHTHPKHRSPSFSFTSIVLKYTSWKLESNSHTLCQKKKKTNKKEMKYAYPKDIVVNVIEKLKVIIKWGYCTSQCHGRLWFAKK